MNSPEYMEGTNRFVLKLDDNSKIIIVRELVNEKISYLVEVTQNIDYALSDFAKECGYIIMFHGLNIEDDMVTLEGTVVENIVLKEEYHIVDGDKFGKFIEAHIPYPEETTRVVPITLCFESIKEMTGDLDMIQDMVNDNMLSVSTLELIKHGIIIKPQLELIKNDEKEETNEKDIISRYPGLLTIVNGRSKIKKK